MPRLKFVAETITRFGGGHNLAQAATAQYLESNSVAIKADGTKTLIIDNVSGDQYHIAKTYTSVITALDTASASPTNAVDLT